MRIICVSLNFRVKKPQAARPTVMADVEQAGKAGGSAGGNAFRQREVAAGP